MWLVKVKWSRICHSAQPACVFLQVWLRPAVLASSSVPRCGLPKACPAAVVRSGRHQPKKSLCYYSYWVLNWCHIIQLDKFDLRLGKWICQCKHLRSLWVVQSDHWAGVESNASSRLLVIRGGFVKLFWSGCRCRSLLSRMVLKNVGHFWSSIYNSIYSK